MFKYVGAIDEEVTLEQMLLLLDSSVRRLDGMDEREGE